MSQSQPMVIKLLSDAAELPGARERVRTWAKDHGWNEHQVADIVLAIDEALTNVIRHGYSGAPGQKIQVTIEDVVSRQHGPGIVIVIRDYGRQAPLEEICGRDLDDLRPGGLGVHIIRSVMDEVSYEHAPGGGMRLTLHKYRSSRKPHHDACEGAEE